MTNQYFPTVLKENEDILFKLRCQEFLELMRDCSEDHMDVEVDSLISMDQLLDPAMQRAMDYGHQLQSDYQHDTRPHIQEALVVGIKCMYYNTYINWIF
jgi:hypothetical protein